jgi:hypothetical protein
MSDACFFFESGSKSWARATETKSRTTSDKKKETSALPAIGVKGGTFSDRTREGIVIPILIATGARNSLQKPGCLSKRGARAEDDKKIRGMASAAREGEEKNVPPVLKIAFLLGGRVGS